MSERMTGINLPGLGFGTGFAEWGRHTPTEMIQIMKVRAAAQKAEAEAILSAADEDFHVATYVGPYAMRQYEVLQVGRQK